MQTQGRTRQATVIKLLLLLLPVLFIACSTRYISSETPKVFENSDPGKVGAEVKEWGGKPQDAEAIFNLLKQDRKVSLAIIIEDIKTPEIKNDPELDRLGDALKEKLLAELEHFHLYAFGKARNFSLVERHRLNALLNEYSLNASGLVDNNDMRDKMGMLLGATHILFVKVKILTTTTLEIRRLIEVKSGKVIAVGVTTTRKRK